MSHFTHEYTNEWEEIRVNWVNGNRTDAKEMLYQCSKHKMLKIIAQALNAHHKTVDVPKGTHSGDLIDLAEILKSFGS